jgi:hypothetical protein
MLLWLVAIYCIFSYFYSDIDWLDNDTVLGSNISIDKVYTSAWKNKN